MTASQPTQPVLRLELSINDHERLKKLSEEHGLEQASESLFNMCLHLTVLAIFLHKTSGDTELVIEAPLQGRFSQQWMNVAGNFIEMIRLSITVTAKDTVLTVYKRTRDTLFDSLKNVKPGCTSTLEPVAVHGVLNLITARPLSTTASSATLTWHHPGHSDIYHPLRLHIADWNATGTPTIDLDLNHAFFVRPYIDRAPEHLAATYRAVLESRETMISDISIVTHSEKWAFSGRDVSADYANESLLPARIEEMATTIPDAIALRNENSSVTYQELNDYAKNIESQLRNRGISNGHRVAVYLPCSLDIPIILLGILRSGAAYVPIDRGQPSLRTREILKDAEVSCMITDADAPDQPDILTLKVDELRHSKSSNPQDQSTSLLPDKDDIVPANPAYVIYTSGSTGKPKGVVVSHGALMSYLNWACGYYELPEPIVMPLFTSIGFDLTVTSLFLPWLSGGTLRVFTHTTDNQALVLLDVIQDKSLNTIKLTPAHLNILINSEAEKTAIRQIIVGGEDFKTETARQAVNHFTQDLRIINEYGPTEATVGCIVRDWRGKPEQGSVPIGLPIDGMSAYVLNDALQPQFEGVTGELFLSGPSLASGYWNNSEMTGKAFIANPRNPDQRLYRTGDHVRVQHDELVFLGRTDGQLKINGYRIELAEIEATLLSHPDINECVVLASPDRDKAEEQGSEQHCIECGLSSKYPDAQFDNSGVCSLCNSFKPNKSRVDEYFRSPDDLSELIKTIKQRRRGDYDALVLLSGGKDSTYALSKLVDLGLNVYAFSLDNGYISDQAKQNIDYVCSKLGVAHHYGTTPHMNSIFTDSLARYSEVCHGCFKTIYNLSLEFAAKHSIDYIFTGLSRGQLFETRLNNELFSECSLPPEKIDDMVQAARVQYHAIKDAPNTLLGIEAANNGTLASQISIVDFYRYYDVELSDMLDYLKSRVGWIRPMDTGRSTNCLINDVGIHVHKLERGFHNYSLPYSWDVRLGHKKRDDALEELDDSIDEENVESILKEIGYSPKMLQPGGGKLHAYYTGSTNLDQEGLTTWLSERLPDYMQPRNLTHLDTMPLNIHGKIDRQAVAKIESRTPSSKSQKLPETPGEKLVASLWEKYIQVDQIYLEDNFFQLGGDSLSAIRCVMELRRMGFTVEPADLFRVPELIKFAGLLDQAPNTLNPVPTSKPERFASLDESQRDRLKSLLARNTTSSE